MPTTTFGTQIDAPFIDDGASTSRFGKIFTCGSYPDKSFTLTPDEARAAIEVFTPVPVRLAHYDRATVADGKCGMLEKVEMDADGVSLIGTYSEPKAFTEWLGNAARKVSLVWDTATKRIVGMDHALNPRIPDAVLFEAIAAFERGDVPPPIESPKEKQMSTPKKGFMAWLRGASDEEVAEFEATVIAPAESPSVPTKSPAEIALAIANERIASFEAAEIAAKTTGLKARAVAFADGLVADKRIVAKGNEEYRQATALFELAAGFEDARPVLACFEEGFEAKDARPVDALTALFANLPQHSKNEEQTTNVDPGTVALFEQAVTVTDEPGQKPPTAARKAELLSKTSLGQAAKETK